MTKCFGRPFQSAWIIRGADSIAALNGVISFLFIPWKFMALNHPRVDHLSKQMKASGVNTRWGAKDAYILVHKYSVYVLITSYGAKIFYEGLTHLLYRMTVRLIGRRSQTITGISGVLMTYNAAGEL
jgi:hypothetical protein